MDSTADGLTLVVRATTVGFDASLERGGMAVSSASVDAWSDPAATGQRIVAWLEPIGLRPTTASFISGPDGPESPPVLGEGWPMFVEEGAAREAGANRMRGGGRSKVLVVAVVVALIGGVVVFLVARGDDGNEVVSTPTTAHAAATSTLPVNPSVTGSNVSGSTGGTVRWALDANTPWSSPAVADDLVVAGQQDSKTVQAVSAATGAVLWSQGIGPIRGRPVIADGVLFFAGSVGAYSAVDAGTGAPKWSQKIQGEPFGLPAITTDAIVVGTADGWVISMDRASGAVRWQVEVSTQIRGSLVASDAVVFVGEASGNLIALDAGTGATRWSARIGSTMVWGATLGKGSVTAVDSTGTVSARNTADGSEIWTVALGGDVQADLASGGGIVAARVGESLVGLDPNRGERRWEVALGGLGAAQPATDGVSVVVVGGRGDVICVEMSTGTMRWSVPSTIGDASGTPAFVGADSNLVIVPAGNTLQTLGVR